MLGGYLAAGVGWINQWHAFGWFAAGVAIFVTIYLTIAGGSALLAKARGIRLDNKLRARYIGDSSPFDPMATIYENKQLYLRDLAPAGRKQVRGKQFIGCELIGPGTAVLGMKSDPAGPDTLMRRCRSHDVDCIQIAPEPRSNLAVEFLDCDFDNCDFYHMTLLFFQRENPTLHWITPDFNQPLLLPDNSGKPDD